MPGERLFRAGGIILAAGASRRMGRPKLLLPFAGRPLIRHALKVALSSGLEPLAAVTAPDSDPLLLDILKSEPGVAVVCAQDAGQGQALSLKAGLAEILRLEGSSPVHGVCVLLGDQPLLRPELVRELVRAAAIRPGRFVLPSFMGRRGNPAFIPRKFFPELMELRGDQGARAIFAREGAEPPHLVEAGDDAVVFDIDTPEDYERLVRSRAEPAASDSSPGDLQWPHPPL